MVFGLQQAYQGQKCLFLALMQSLTIRKKPSRLSITSQKIFFNQVQLNSANKTLKLNMKEYKNFITTPNPSQLLFLHFLLTQQQNNANLLLILLPSFVLFGHHTIYRQYLSKFCDNCVLILPHCTIFSLILQFSI